MSDRVLAVVGGGVVGLSVAWRAAQAGFGVRVIDPEPASGASWVAGGMLAPIAEAWPGDEPLLELGAASLRRWPDFAAELADASGRDSGLRTDGTVVVAVDSADRETLDALADHLGGLGREVARHTGRELRRIEPALGPDVHGGLDVPGDYAVDNRVTLAALRAACERAGVEFVNRAASAVHRGSVELDSADDATVSCDEVVIAAGAYSARLHPELRRTVRPVKGEILRVQARRGALPPPERTVRGPVHGRPVYLVPRADGGLVIGATQYEAGFDTDVTVGGVRDLLADAEALMPALSEYALVEAIAGLRPTTEDNLPVLGELEPGVLAATGHHRGGFLLAPITAETVVARLEGREAPEVVAAADPARCGAHAQEVSA